MPKSPGLASPSTFKEVIPMRKHYFLLSILVLSISLSVPQTLRGQQPTCMANSNIPAGYVPFTSIYYISGRDEAGDLLVVGSMTAASYSGLSGVTLPNAANQQFCNPITLAPGIVANAYVPTPGERLGGFGNFANILFDPTCVEGCPSYYPNGQIPITEIPGVFAWRIPPKQPGPPVYVSNYSGGQILAVDGSSGVTSVLYTSDFGDWPEGMAVGPDNLIYAVSPSNSRIFRIDQSGGSLETVYQYSCSGETCPPDQPQGPSFSTTGQLAFNTQDGEGVWQISFDSSDNPSPPVQIIPSAAATGEGTTFNLADELLIVDQSYPDVLQQTSPGATTATTLIFSSYPSLSTPMGVAVNSSGNIFVANLNVCSECGEGGEFLGGYITQFKPDGTRVNTYATFNAPDAPTFMQFDASGNLYAVTVQDWNLDNGKVWRLPPPVSPATTSTPILLVDLNYAYSNGTVRNLSWGGAEGVALSGTGTTDSYTTTPLPVTPGTPVTYTYGNITNQTVLIPSGSDLGGAASIAVDFQLWNPSVFDTTRLPATSTNGWSGGTPVPGGTTCTPIAGTGGNCIVIEDLCFDSNGKQIPCQIFAPSGSLITLTSTYQTQSPQPNPGLIIAGDGLNNWANITYPWGDITGHTNGLNTDTAIVNINLSGLAPTVTFSAPATAAYQSSFNVTTSTNASTNAVITATAGSVCTVSGTTVTMTSGTGTCNLTAFWPADTTYAAAYATQSTLATGPLASVSTASLSFGSQVISTTSAARIVMLTSTGTANLSMPGITITGTNAGDFSEANTCTAASYAPGAKCTISVTYTPSILRAETANLAVTDNAANSPQIVALSGYGEPPVVLYPTPLNFGNVGENSPSASKNIKLYNNQSVALTISGITLTNHDYTETDDCIGSVAAKGYCTISVTLTPSSLGADNGTLSVNDNASNSPQTATLTGTGILPAQLSATSVSFGYVGENSPSASKNIKLYNNQSVALTISGITLSNPDYTEADTCKGSVAAKGYCTISVTLTPSSLRADNGTLSVNDNASNSPQTATLTGTGILPAQLSATSVSFGYVPQSTASTSKKIALYDNETVALNISSISTGNPDFTETDTCNGSVPAKGNCTITVTFTPSVIGAETGTLTVTDAASNSPQTASLAGRGIAQTTVSPTSLTFAAQKAGTTSAAKNVTLTNNLSTALTISSITFTGANGGDFAETDTCDGSLAAKSQCTISVTFKPTATGTRTATLNVNDSANNSPQTSQLTGTGR
jgi:hypothetical protein